MTTTTAVATEGLRKRYGDTAALDGLDLYVPEGVVYGLLGPNGAGKTTAVRALTTLARFDSGRAQVAGFDVQRQPDQVRYRIGLVGQNAAVDEILSGRQNLVLFGKLYHLGGRAARARADQLLDQFGLSETGRKPVGQYSGGMRRRLDLAASLIMAPRVLFLDEPTTGLDPRARAEVWDTVRSLVAGGTTVVLTTQYLEEADQLAHRVAVIDHGRVIAEGTPGELKSRIGGDQIDITLSRVDELAKAAQIISRITGAAAMVDDDARRVSSPVTDRATALTASLRALEDAGLATTDVAVRQPTLDEVFLRLTGQPQDQP